MIGGLNALFAATVLFVGGHFLLSSLHVRMALVGKLGETRFLTFYSVAMVAVFVWMILAFINTPADTLWSTPPALLWLPAVAMPIAIFLIVCGLSTPSPTLAGTKLDERAGRSRRNTPLVQSKRDAKASTIALPLEGVF